MSKPVQPGPATDARNRRIVAATISTFLGYGLHHDPQLLLEDGFDAERATYARRVVSRLKYLALLICAAILVGALIPKPAKPIPAPPTYTEAGNVVSVQLHDTTFSRSTSVVTSEGTFQVVGAVSAAPGDVAMIKKVVESGTVEVTSLCVASQYKRDCYRLL